MEGNISQVNDTLTGQVNFSIGITPQINVGEIETLNPNEEAYVELDESSTKLNPVLNFGIPKGETGPQGIQGIQGIQGPKGDKGDKGDTGEQGLKGDKGDTGSTGAKGDKGDKGDTGANGTDGQDGFSPTATVSKVGKVATISITDKNGTTTATISDGEDGQSGSSQWGGITGTLSNQKDLYEEIYYLGKNLLYYGTDETFNDNGLYMSYDDMNDCFKFDGTAEEATTFSSSAGAYLEANTTYTFSYYWNTRVWAENSNIKLYDDNDNLIVTLPLRNPITGEEETIDSITFTPLADADISKIEFDFASGFNGNYKELKLQLEEGDTSTSFEPYVNNQSKRRYADEELVRKLVEKVVTRDILNDALYVLQDTILNEYIANPYSASSTYTVGDIVNHESNIYVCRVNISTPEEFNSAKWFGINQTIYDILTEFENTIYDDVQPTIEDMAEFLGDPEDLTTTDKTNLVAAINEVNGKIGDINTVLSSLTTPSNNGGGN